MDRVFTWFAGRISFASGQPLAFVLAFGTILVWGVTGPIFGFSDTWQLVINTTTTIATFLMVFLIQNTQNRDNAAIQAKLEELNPDLAPLFDKVEADAAALHEKLVADAQAVSDATTALVAAIKECQEASATA